MSSEVVLAHSQLNRFRCPPQHWKKSFKAFDRSRRHWVWRSAERLLSLASDYGSTRSARRLRDSPRQPWSCLSGPIRFLRWETGVLNWLRSRTAIFSLDEKENTRPPFLASSFGTPIQNS